MDKTIIITNSMENDSNETITSSLYMTKFEYQDIIGKRAQFLKDGATPLVPFTKQNYIEIAERELKEKKINWYIKRKLPNNIIEKININSLIIIY